MANAERDKWVKIVTTVYKARKKQFDDEAKQYIRMFKNDFKGLLPSRLFKTDSVDINVIYPVIKTLLPNLYFKDPQVYVKPLQEKIVRPIVDENGEVIINPLTGNPEYNEYDPVLSASKLQQHLNDSIVEAKLKYHIKRVIVDAHLCPFGAIKCGWGNDQGFASMGEDGVPPSMRDDVEEGRVYGKRLKPWNVVIDPENFENPQWIAVRDSVPVANLKNDKRLWNTSEIKGNSDLSDDENIKKYMEGVSFGNDFKRVEYFELYIKPCAEYPKGKYYLMTEEVEKGFLYASNWPTKAKSFPIKLLFFTPDPEDDLPIQDVRYYVQQQKAKLNLRNAEYEFVVRTMPALGIDYTGIKDRELVEQQITSGQIPRVVGCTRNPSRVINGISYPNLSIDFRRLDENIDRDISKAVGLTNVMTPGGGELATSLKISSQGDQIRQNERADTVSEFIVSVVEYWAQLVQEFAGIENSILIEGDKRPVKWSRDEINGKFKYRVKPFSMNYEDPMVVRKQWVDLLNLLSAPELRQSLMEQGAEVDILKIIRRVLETYDEKDVESFVFDTSEKAENQVADAVQENQEIMNRLQVVVNEKDNHKIHLIIHGMLGEIGQEHILAHEEAMTSELMAGNSPGGGNEEGLPVNGVATNQDLISAPLKTSPENTRIAIKREAGKGY